MRRLSTNADSDGDSGLFTQRDSGPLTEDQLINEVGATYAGLAMVEKKCIEVDKRQTELKTQLSTIRVTMAGSDLPAPHTAE